LQVESHEFKRLDLQLVLQTQLNTKYGIVREEIENIQGIIKAYFDQPICKQAFTYYYVDPPGRLFGF